jgi:hypothetical protein
MRGGGQDITTYEAASHHLGMKRFSVATGKLVQLADTSVRGGKKGSCTTGKVGNTNGLYIIRT